MRRMVLTATVIGGFVLSLAVTSGRLSDYLTKFVFTSVAAFILSFSVGSFAMSTTEFLCFFVLLLIMSSAWPMLVYTQYYSGLFYGSAIVDIFVFTLIGSIVGRLMTWWNDGQADTGIADRIIRMTKVISTFITGFLIGIVGIWIFLEIFSLLLGSSLTYISEMISRHLKISEFPFIAFGLNASLLSFVAILTVFLLSKSKLRQLKPDLYNAIIHGYIYAAIFVTLFAIYGEFLFHT